ncbi:MAG: septum formation inhibitor Maf [Nitrospirae bacterium]|nr:septum formation inhibitor Maf [Nitrospirota bacterium]
MRLILASDSPRRKAILEQAGYSFEVRPARIVERRLPRETGEAFARRVALEKARAVAAELEEGVVIGADTVVVVGEEILGKPESSEDAVAMLRKLGGREHRVLTAVAVVDAATGWSETAIEETRVWFRPLAEEEIAAYIATGEPLDKAGAYGIQERGGLLVDRIEGDYLNVVGLPLGRVMELIRRFSVGGWRQEVGG